jgi:voltage-gated sodium channel
MSDSDLAALRQLPRAAPWRLRIAALVEAPRTQTFIIGFILLNAAVLGFETNPGVMTSAWGGVLVAIDRVCLAVFVAELVVKLAVYRGLFWRSGWNGFDLAVVAVALVPGAGPWSVLRTLRVLRVLRLLTVIPQLRRVVAAFLHAIPGLMGVIAVMMIFFYTAGVLATKLFGSAHPQWFGTLGESLYTLFQVMTLESWSMGIARPVMEVHPWAWAFFVPFIVIATFTILNLFIGIIVSTMQELAVAEVEVKRAADAAPKDPKAVIARIESDLAELRRQLG